MIKFESFVAKRKLSAHSIIDLQQLLSDDVFEILNEAVRLKVAAKVGEINNSLQGKNVVLVTTKHQGVGQLAFSSAVSSLSGNGTILPLGGASIDSFLSSEEITQVISGLGISAFVVETSVEGDAETLAKHVKAPVINAFSGGSPTGSVAAIMAVFEKIGRLSGLKVAYVANGKHTSILTAMAKFGMDITFVSPEEHAPDKDVVEYCRQFVDVEHTTDLDKALLSADVVFVCNDFGEEYKLTLERLALLKQNAGILHRLPLSGAEDVDEEILKDPRCLVVETAINVSHVEKACLELLCGKIY